MINYLNTFNIFSEQELEEFSKLGVSITLKKNDYFIKEGSICKNIAFIKSGIFRSYYSSSNEEENTYCLLFPNNFVTAYTSFITQEKTVENIQAISDVELIMFPKKALDNLVATNNNWLLFFKIVAEQEYIKLEKRVFQLQNEKAEKRYSELFKNHPEYIQNVPLGFLASYLGITLRHLSRIRKQITN